MPCGAKGGASGQRIPFGFAQGRLSAAVVLRVREAQLRSVMTELGDWRTFSEEGGGMRLRAILSGVILILLLFVLLVPTGLWGQTDCEAGNGLLDFAPPK